MCIKNEHIHTIYSRSTKNYENSCQRRHERKFNLNIWHIYYYTHKHSIEALQNYKVKHITQKLVITS